MADEEVAYSQEAESIPSRQDQARSIAERALVFEELITGYYYDCKNKDGEIESSFIPMDVQEKVFYQKTNNAGDPLEEKFPLDKPPTDIDKEICHGITLRQIRGLWANVERRCLLEEWKDWKGNRLTPETVSLHDVKKYVVEPFTEEKRKSFVSCLPSSSTYQVPRILISAPFILPIKELVACLEAFVHDFRTNFTNEHERRGGGMSENTPVWLVGFARNVWDDCTYPDDPMQTPMAKAIKVTQNRVLSITDKDGTYFTRAWTSFESYLAMEYRLWYIYTAHDGGHHGGAVGLISGGATSDNTPTKTLDREKCFPTAIIVKCIEHNVKNVSAEIESDTTHVLNKIIGSSDLYVEPPEADGEYDTSYNDSFRAHFVTPGTLQAALLQKDDSWQKMLKVMKKGKMSMMRFDFKEGSGWDDMADDEATELIKHLPKTIKDLSIWCGDFGQKFILALGKWIESSNVERLHLKDTLVNSSVDNDTIKYFAKALKGNKKLENLQIWRVNQDNEHKIWEEDVHILKTLAQSEECVATALFDHFNILVNENNPDYTEMTFLMTLFIRTKRSFSDYVTPEQRHSIMNWVNGLGEPARAALFHTEAGSFVKVILNNEFTTQRHFGIVMVDLYVQLTIVLLLSHIDGKIDADLSTFFRPLLIICLTWILLREVMQMLVTYTKQYIKDESNLIDLIQIILLFRIITVFTGEDQNSRPMLHASAICFSWFCLIYDLSDLNFKLAVFVTSVVKIIGELIPFLFAAVLLTLMFAHAFRAIFSGETCIEEDVAWCSSSRVDSYMFALTWFLNSEFWYFGEGPLDRGPGYYLTCIYALFMGLILMNMTIAIVNNKFTEVQQDAKTAFWENRFTTTIEIRQFCKLKNIEFRWWDLIQKILGKRYFEIHRFNFSVHSEMPDVGESDSFFNWWFSPRGGNCPNLSDRMQAFYSYSRWDDIIYPGMILEKILLGQHCNMDPSAGNTNEKVHQAIFRILKNLIITICLYFLLIIHTVIMVIVFICGAVSLGILWPQVMKQKLFHMNTKHDVSDTKELMNDNDMLKEELRNSHHKLREEQNKRFDSIMEDLKVLKEASKR